MRTVFISSIQDGYTAERQAAKAAVESLGMHATMAEAVGAADATPQRALLDQVAASDVFLLIIGPRYSAPTEEEYDHAVRLGKPLLVLVAEDLDDGARDFRDRVTHGWQDGRLRDSFADTNSLTLAAVQALRSLESRPSQDAALGTARSRAEDLARGTAEQLRHTSGDIVCVLVPAVTAPILDAVALGDPSLSDTIAAQVRAHRLASQSEALVPRATSSGVSVQRQPQHGMPTPLVDLLIDGAVVAVVGASGDGSFASTVIDPDRILANVRQVVAFAQSAWDIVDTRREIDYVALTLAVPSASNRVFGRSPTGNSITMGGAMSLPQTVIAPTPPIHVRRAQLGSDDPIHRALAALRLIYSDANALAHA